MLDISAQLSSKGKIKNRQSISATHAYDASSGGDRSFTVNIAAVDQAKTAIVVHSASVYSSATANAEGSYLKTITFNSNAQLAINWWSKYVGSGNNYIYLALEIVEFE